MATGLLVVPRRQLQKKGFNGNRPLGPVFRPHWDRRKTGTSKYFRSHGITKHSLIHHDPDLHQSTSLIFKFLSPTTVFLLLVSGLFGYVIRLQNEFPDVLSKLLKLGHDNFIVLDQ